MQLLNQHYTKAAANEGWCCNCWVEGRECVEGVCGRGRNFSARERCRACHVTGRTGGPSALHGRHLKVPVCATKLSGMFIHIELLDSFILYSMQQHFPRLGLIIFSSEGSTHPLTVGQNTIYLAVWWIRLTSRFYVIHNLGCTLGIV